MEISVVVDTIKNQKLYNDKNMRREAIIRRKRAQEKSFSEKGTNSLKKQSKELLKHPIAKGVAVVVTLYGILFVSKYIIKEYAEVVVATKKLRDAHRL